MALKTPAEPAVTTFLGMCLLLRILHLLQTIRKSEPKREREKKVFGSCFWALVTG